LVVLQLNMVALGFELVLFSTPEVTDKLYHIMLYTSP
jgi:hypothetical protein